MTTKINALGIGTTITVDDTPVTIIDRAPGGPGLMWATDNRGGVLQNPPRHRPHGRESRGGSDDRRRQNPAWGDPC